MKYTLAFFSALLLLTSHAKCDANPGDTHLFTSHSFISHPPLVITKGHTIPFDNGSSTVGGNIKQTSTDTITINSTGTYCVTFMASTYSLDSTTVADLVSATDTAQVQLYLNGKAVGPESTIGIRGAGIVLDTLLSIPTIPATLVVKVNNDDLRLGKSNPATLSIYKISNNP